MSYELIETKYSQYPLWDKKNPNISVGIFWILQETMKALQWVRGT